MKTKEEELKEVIEKNKKLKDQLWSKGYYVQEIGQYNKPEYLIVSCIEPKDNEFMKLKKLKNHKNKT